jgi:hypothetical protein
VDGTFRSQSYRAGHLNQMGCLFIQWSGILGGLAECVDSVHESAVILLELNEPLRVCIF